MKSSQRLAIRLACGRERGDVNGYFFYLNDMKKVDLLIPVWFLSSPTLECERHWVERAWYLSSCEHDIIRKVPKFSEQGNILLNQLNTKY